MEQLLAYLVKLSVTLMLLFVFYRFVLQKLTFYMLNRWYLFGYSVAAFFIPLININPFLEHSSLSEQQFVQWIPAVNATGLQGVVTVESENLSPAFYSLLLIAAGIMVLLIRFCIRYFSVRSFRRRASLISDGAVKVYHIDQDVNPFSFGSSIFVNTQCTAYASECCR